MKNPKTHPADKMREISISWFTDLTGRLGKYLAVLRYELAQYGDMQTVEALIHAEITKILIRQLTPGCVTTEYAIGTHFAKGINDIGKEFDRKLRADIAIYHPVDDPECSKPMAVIELKREGSKTDLLDDIYRLAIVSLKENSTGYFVFAGPAKLVKSALKKVPMLQTMQNSAEDVETDGPHKFLFTDLEKSSLYNTNDFLDAKDFYGQRMFGGEDVSEGDPYQIRIFAFHAKQELLKTGQRIDLTLGTVAPRTKEMQPLAPID